MPSLKKNLIYQIGYEVFALLVPLIVSPYISRVIQPEGVGLYSYTYSIANYFVLFSMLGLKTYGSRAIAMIRTDRCKLNHTFSSLLYLHIIISVIVTILYFSMLIISNIENKKYLWFQSLFVISSIFDISWFYFGIEKFKISVLRNFFVKVFTVTLIFLFIKTEEDIDLYFLIMSSGILLGQVILWLPLHNYCELIRCDLNTIFGHLKPMAILFIPTIAVSLYRYFSNIALGVFGSSSEVGFFSNADMIVSVPTAIIGAIGVVMLPRMSNIMHNNCLEKFQKYLDLSIRYFMMISIGMTFGIAAISKRFAIIYWGNEFYMSGVLLHIMVFSIPFITFANIIRTQYLIPHKNDRLYCGSVLVGGLISVIINIVLIPVIGVYGAVIALFAAEVSVCIIQSMGINRRIKIRKYLSLMFYYIIFGILMYLCVTTIGVYTKLSIYGLVLQILVGVLIYCGLILIYYIKNNDPILLIINKNIYK